MRTLPILPTAAELALAVLLMWLALAGMTLAEGQIGISWDMLNHQIYLGWSADGPRFDRDVMPAAYQTYQFPYLYWPLYKLATGGATGVQVGLALATLQIGTVPAVWIVARSCIPEITWFGTGMRLLAVGFAFLSALVISLFTTTTNDLLAAAPLLWAFAIMFPYAAQAAPAPVPRWLFALSGALGGISVAFKLSNGPLVLVLPFLWLLVRQPLRRKSEDVALGCVTILLAFFLTYGSWGWQLWQLHGNPIYPFAEHWFGLLRPALGWKP